MAENPDTEQMGMSGPPAQKNSATVAARVVTAISYALFTVRERLISTLITFAAIVLVVWWIAGTISGDIPILPPIPPV
ncbi:hypothetical protein [Rhodococcus erythropolis]|uniref:hypothetical protein n=1 Tax=Rhodococcus erythropolis TaxID=1833 RepID=UPI001BE555C3|nr:hypothetical protein [Rhodococcus erythropolis]MBT2269648.1 hypothetical protein [Rhodococcus erythropolis]